jgi:guanylate cyclase, other
MIFPQQMAKRVHIKAHPSQLSLAPVTARLLLELFPFGLLFDKKMKICGAGEKILEAWSTNNNNKAPNLLMGTALTEYFRLRRPTGITLDWDTVSCSL